METWTQLIQLPAFIRTVAEALHSDFDLVDYGIVRVLLLQNRENIPLGKVNEVQLRIGETQIQTVTNLLASASPILASL